MEGIHVKNTTLRVPIGFIMLRFFDRTQIQPVLGKYNMSRLKSQRKTENVL